MYSSVNVHLKKNKKNKKQYHVFMHAFMYHETCTYQHALNICNNTNLINVWDRFREKGPNVCDFSFFVVDIAEV